MTAAIAMNIPGGRAVVTWWRDLATRHPRRLWFAHLALHHIEALVERETSFPLDNLAQSLYPLLRSLEYPIPLTRLHDLLGLDAALTSCLITQLISSGVLALDSTETALYFPPNIPSPSQPIAKHLRQRAIFHFTDGTPPLFVSIDENACSALMPPSTWSFDLDQLRQCLAQPESWRSRNQFLEGSCRLLLPEDLLGQAQNEVLALALDRAEQALLVLIQTEAELLGFSVNPEDWEMRREPAVKLPLTADLSQALLAPLPPEQWRQAWQLWCQQRSLPTAEVESCRLEVADHRLLVRAPGRLVDRLRQSRADSTRGDTWLLAGTGRVRHAALVELAS